MNGKIKVFVPRSIDRAIFAILAALHVANGAYLIGPWYLDEYESGKAPLYDMFNSDLAVSTYGAVLFLNGVVLLTLSCVRHTHKHYAAVLGITLLTGFLMRLYAFIAVLMIVESWRPPSYLSHLASVGILGSYWVWVRLSGRPTK